VIQVAPDSPKNLTKIEVVDSRIVRERIRSWMRVGKGRRESGSGGRWKIESEEREMKTKV